MSVPTFHTTLYKRQCRAPNFTV